MSMKGPREFTSSAKTWEYLRRKAATTKAQELREKLAKDTQQIRDRNNKGTEEGPSPGLSDLQQTCFAKLESNEQLQMLLSLATATANAPDNDTDIDISNAYFACKTLLDNLEKRRLQKLLPQVFGVLRMNQYLEYIQDQDPKNVEEEKEANTAAVLNLRLVSKAWKDAADAQFLTPVEFSKPDWHLNKDYCNLMVMSSPFKCKFEKVEDVESAMKALGPNKELCSSKLLRIVDINMKGDGNDNADDEYVRIKGFSAKLGRFLDLHGEHVWALHFAGRFEYEIIRRLVSRMPNLKELFLNRLEDWTETDDLALSEKDEKLKIVMYPFPTLPFLTRIAFDNIPEYKSLTNEILQRNPSLKTVSIADEDPSELQEFYPTLANLKLECFDLNLGEETYSLFPEIKQLVQMNWPLKVLNLSLIDQASNVEIVSTGKLFEIVNQFNETLEEIDLEAMALQDHEDGSSWVVQDFPKLKNINKVVGLCSL